jgi:hypothetical protein
VDYLSIIVKGTSTGAVTDVNGKYQIPVLEDAMQLVSTFMGYTSQTVDLSGQTNINVILQTVVKPELYVESELEYELM